MNKIALTFAVFVLVGLTSSELIHAQKFADSPSEIADAHSEANSIRAAEGYLDLGFFTHASLPVITYGDKFPEIGSGAAGNEGSAYTHYPQGPILLLGLMTYLCGKENLFCMRLLPISFGMTSIAVLAWTLIHSWGGILSMLVLGACAAVPMFSNMMHGLYYQGYAMALLFLQLSTLLQMAANGWQIHRFHYAILTLLGFFQGWLSFDFFFLVSLTPAVAVCFWQGRFSNQRKAYKTALHLCFFSALGFALAHLIHFGQVVSYLGSLSAALADFTQAAARRMDNSVNAVVRITDQDMNPFTLMKRYLSWYAAREVQFGFRLWPLLGFTFCLLAGLSAFGAKEHRQTAFFRLMSIGLAVSVSTLWILVMRQHAAIHASFIPRHLFLAYFWCIFAIGLTAVERWGYLRARVREVISARSIHVHRH